MNEEQAPPTMAKKKPSSARDECAATFEESLEELEKIVAELESGQLGLSDALARYEQGVKHLKSCQQLLERAERKIELLSGVDADGNPIVQPFDEQEDASLEEKARDRARRRSKPRSAATASRPPADTENDGELTDMDAPGRLF